MAKRGRPKTSDRTDVPIKVEKAIANKAKLIANHKGVPVAALISDILRKPIDAAYVEMIRELEASGGL